MVMPVDPQTTGQREGASEWEQAAGAGGEQGGDVFHLGFGWACPGLIGLWAVTQGSEE